MWHGIGFLAGLLAIAIIVWEGLRLANMKSRSGSRPAMVTAALAMLLLVFAFIRFISTRSVSSSNDVDRTFWAWLGLLLAILIVVCAWANMKQPAIRCEMGASMKTAASSAAAAAKAATDKGDDAPAAAPAARGSRCRRPHRPSPRRLRPLPSRRRLPQPQRPRPPRHAAPTTRRPPPTPA